MTFKERLNKEKDNHSKIILFNDKGLFYNVLERSAYAFHTRIRPFKVHVKALKGLDEPFVSIGVPVAQKDTYLKFLSVTTDDQGNVIAQLDEAIDENDFQAWKKHIIEQNNSSKENVDDITLFPAQTGHNSNPGPVNNENETIIRQCVAEVKTLNIAAMTPMEAMMFLNELQIKLKNVSL